MTNPNIITFLCEKNCEYAAGAVAGRIEMIRAELARARRVIERDALDAADRDNRRYAEGVTSGLVQALKALGVEE